MKSLTIGQVAKQAGVGSETIRYYEREGLLEQAKRKASGYRQFDEQAVDRLRFIRRAKELGFTLKEIKELLSMQVDPVATCVDVKSRAETKIIDIENRIRSLQKIKKALVKLTKTCEGNGAASKCVILESLQPAKSN